MGTRPAIVWFRDDLRLDDHPALQRAVASGRPVVALWVLDEASPGLRPLGGAARWWLDRSLRSLARALEARGGRLILRRGPASHVVPAVIEETGAEAVYWNRRYGAAERAIDCEIEADLDARGIEVESFQGSVLFEPPTTRTGTGGPYRVFTPFWRACRTGAPPRAPQDAPARIVAPALPLASDDIDAWGLTPTAPDWSGGIADAWTPGEADAAERLATFLCEGIYSYAKDRDRPDLEAVSRLSPHLRFGEISPFRVWAAVDAVAVERPAASVEKFRAELGWREFCHHLAFHFPDLEERSFQPRFDAFAWRDDPAFLAAWRRGRTGYPLVDAGMRQLWQTGWMHNRVRMVVASFLAKHGLIDWRHGERWFWDTLVDACPANNPAGWQWVAGCGADAAPYFRIFNPITQSETFDPDGAYIRRFVPELAQLPTDAIHAPWKAPASALQAAGVRLGETYPRPIVDHATARTRALAAFAATAAGRSEDGS